MSVEITHIEARYVTVSGNETDRKSVSLSQCLRTELGLKGVTSTFWGKVVSDSILSTYANSPGFMEHIKTHSKEMWNMEQSARRLLKEDAKYFTNNQKTALIESIKSRGVKFDRQFSYIYKDWFDKYHSYIKEPYYAIGTGITIPSDQVVWFMTIQLYPRIFYEDQTTGISWRKGGIKVEKLVWVEDHKDWFRNQDNNNNAKTIEVAWYCSETTDVSESGVHTLENNEIVKI